MEIFYLILNFQIIIHRKNVFLLEFQNFLQHCPSGLSFLCNYFDGPTKLFLDLHLSKFLDILAKSFFPFFISNL